MAPMLISTKNLDDTTDSFIPATIMATSRDTPNPLRPYYIPPSIGLPPDSSAPNGTATSSPSYSSASTKPSFGSQARDILSDLDYGDYFPDNTPTLAEHAKRLVDQALWNYTSVLLAQPFEVAKTVLQVHLAVEQKPPGILVNGEQYRSRPSSYTSGKYEDYPSEEDDTDDSDSAGYFTSTAPRTQNLRSELSRSPTRRRRAPSRSNSSTPTQAFTKPPHKIELKKPDSLLEVLAQIWQKEAAWGVWKGTNVTFVYNFLLKTTENWTRSLLSALLNVPDPGLMGVLGSGIGGLDIVDSPNPFMSLAVAVAAAAIAAVALSPLDLIRTRLIVTPTSAPPRTIFPSLSLLPSLTLPSSLLSVTLLHSTIPTIISSATPLFLRSTFAVDPVLTPSTYSIATFVSSAGELFLRLPLETVLRRGQVAVLQDHENQRLSEAYRTLPAHPQPRRGRSAYDSDSDEQPVPEPEQIVRGFKTIVDPGPYKGVFGTMWFIVREEGMQITGPSVATSAAAKPGYKAPGFASRARVRKGQGVHGLWRGWRVGFWGLVGVWGAAALGGSSGGEF
ncbi:mitochondrial carrier [Delitschia confertaspora ATCC 74209]|uniref:Mitochondrial carrier n=1 Tax=Delitschia confertaspora ATCC 74209 TaxID=1513339 RepID=A0A9P4JWE0_9PLEO|nr:mitochondrial carrier [Delitschia confertaspora ATCC 74209]